MLTAKIRIFIKRKKVVSALILCFILLLSFCGGAVLVGATRSVEAAGVTPKNGVFSLQDAPKNTVMSLERTLFAHDFRAELLFYKVALTADGILITLDGELNEQSNAENFFGDKNAKPSEYSYAQLRGLNMGENFEKDGFPYRGLRGENIPEDLKILSVLELFEKCRSNTQLLFLFQITDSGKNTAKALGKLNELLTQFELSNRVTIVASQRVAYLIDKSFHTLNRTASPTETSKLYLDFVFGIEPKNLRYKTIFITSQNFYLNIAGGDFINFAHKYRLEVYISTKNDNNDILKQIKRNADAIISSVPSITFDRLTRG